MSDVKLTLEPELETPAPGIPTLTAWRKKSP